MPGHLLINFTSVAFGLMVRIFYTVYPPRVETMFSLDVFLANMTWGLHFVSHSAWGAYRR